MSGDDTNRDAERAFGGDAPSSGADAFGGGGFQPPSTPPTAPSTPPRPQSAPVPAPTHGGFVPPEMPAADPVAPPPPPPPQSQPSPAGPAPTSTWPPVRDPATTAGHASTWPPPDPGYKLPAAAGATASLVLGIISWIICPIVLSIPAIILSRKARAEIDASPTPLGGKDSASAGFWLGISSLIVWGGFLIIEILIEVSRNS